MPSARTPPIVAHTRYAITSASSSPRPRATNTSPVITMPWSVIDHVGDSKPIHSRANGSSTATAVQPTTAQARSVNHGIVVIATSAQVTTSGVSTNGLAIRENTTVTARLVT